MRQQLLDDLIAHLKSVPDLGSSLWCDERDRLIEEMQSYRDTLVYVPCTRYRLERHYMRETTEYVEGKWTKVPHPCESNIPECPRTPDLKVMKANVQKMLETYPLKELRLYYGSKRIRDIESWLNEE